MVPTDLEFLGWANMAIVLRQMLDVKKRMVDPLRDFQVQPMMREEDRFERHVVERPLDSYGKGRWENALQCDAW